MPDSFDRPLFFSTLEAGHSTLVPTMTLFAHSSIQRKLTSIIMLTSCIALLLACGAFVIYERSSFRTDLVSQMSTIADITGRNCAATLSFDKPEDAQKILLHLAADRLILATCIYKDRKVWAKFPLALKDELLPPVAGQSGHRFATDRLQLFHPILDPDNGEQLGVLFLESNLNQITYRIRR